MRTISLLIGSNVFMIFAWYGHLKYRAAPLWLAILASWGIAFFEQRIHRGAAEIIQEVVTLAAFAIFAVVYLGDPITWRYGGAFICLLGALGFMFVGR